VGIFDEHTRGFSMSAVTERLAAPAAEFGRTILGDYPNLRAIRRGASPDQRSLAFVVAVGFFGVLFIAPACRSR